MHKILANHRSTCRKLLRFWDAIDDGWLRLAGYEF